MNIEYTINESKINNWLEEIETDRKKLFDSVKTNKETDKIKENKILKLESIQKQLLSYKHLLYKEKQEKEKY
jgi:hypothetical protein